MVMTEEEIEDLLQKDGIGTFVVNGKDGYPVAVPVGFTWENGRVYVMAGVYRKKLIGLNDKVTFNVYGDTLGDARWVSISGTATLTTEKGRERVHDIHLHSGLSTAEADKWMEIIQDPSPELIEIEPEYMRSWNMKAPDFVRRRPVATWFS